MVRRLMGAAACALMLSVGLIGSSPVAQADAGSPTVSGPVTGGNGVPSFCARRPRAFDLASVGYAQSEFFVEGTASAYSPTSPLTTDGRWSVVASSEAAYTTRIVVNRPVRRRDFNGTVVVEWLNVSGGADAAPDWIHMHDELIRRGLRLGRRVGTGGGAQRAEGRLSSGIRCGTRR